MIDCVDVSRCRPVVWTTHCKVERLPGKVIETYKLTFFAGDTSVASVNVTDIYSVLYAIASCMKCNVVFADPTLIIKNKNVG